MISNETNATNVFQVVNLDDKTNSDVQLLNKLINNACLINDRDCGYELVEAKFIRNSKLKEQYDETRRELLTKPRFFCETIAFCVIDDGIDSEKNIEEIAYNGCTCRKIKINHLGDSAMGVYLCKHLDVLLAYSNKKYRKLKCIMFKIVFNNLQLVDSLYEYNKPDHNYNCRKFNELPNINQSFLKQYLNSMIYVYDFDKNDELMTKPRTILPYALLTFERIKTINENLNKLTLNNGHTDPLQSGNNEIKTEPTELAEPTKSFYEQINDSINSLEGDNDDIFDLDSKIKDVKTEARETCDSSIDTNGNILSKSRIIYERTGRYDVKFRGKSKMKIKITDIKQSNMKFLDDEKSVISLTNSTNRLILDYIDKRKNPSKSAKASVGSEDASNARSIKRIRAMPSNERMVDESNRSDAKKMDVKNKTNSVTKPVLNTKQANTSLINNNPNKLNKNVFSQNTQVKQEPVSQNKIEQTKPLNEIKSSIDSKTTLSIKNSNSTTNAPTSPAIASLNSGSTSLEKHLMKNRKNLTNVPSSGTTSGPKSNPTTNLTNINPTTTTTSLTTSVSSSLTNTTTKISNTVNNITKAVSNTSNKPTNVPYMHPVYKATNIQNQQRMAEVNKFVEAKKKEEMKQPQIQPKKVKTFWNSDAWINDLSEGKNYSRQYYEQNMLAIEAEMRKHCPERYYEVNEINRRYKLVNFNNAYVNRRFDETKIDVSNVDKIKPYNPSIIYAAGFFDMEITKGSNSASNIISSQSGSDICNSNNNLIKQSMSTPNININTSTTANPVKKIQLTEYTSKMKPNTNEESIATPINPPVLKQAELKPLTTSPVNNTAKNINGNIITPTTTPSSTTTTAVSTTTNTNITVSCTNVSNIPTITNTVPVSTPTIVPTSTLINKINTNTNTTVTLSSHSNLEATPLTRQLSSSSSSNFYTNISIKAEPEIVESSENSIKKEPETKIKRKVHRELPSLSLIDELKKHIASSKTSNKMLKSSDNDNLSNNDSLSNCSDNESQREIKKLKRKHKSRKINKMLKRLNNSKNRSESNDTASSSSTLNNSNNNCHVNNKLNNFKSNKKRKKSKKSKHKKKSRSSSVSSVSSRLNSSSVSSVNSCSSSPLSDKNNSKHIKLEPNRQSQTPNSDSIATAISVDNVNNNIVRLNSPSSLKEIKSSSLTNSDLVGVKEEDIDSYYDSFYNEYDLSIQNLVTSNSEPAISKIDESVSPPKAVLSASTIPQPITPPSKQPLIQLQPQQQQVLPPQRPPSIPRPTSRSPQLVSAITPTKKPIIPRLPNSAPTINNTRFQMDRHLQFSSIKNRNITQPSNPILNNNFHMQTNNPQQPPRFRKNSNPSMNNNNNFNNQMLDPHFNFNEMNPSPNIQFPFNIPQQKKINSNEFALFNNLNNATYDEFHTNLKVQKQDFLRKLDSISNTYKHTDAQYVQPFNNENNNNNNNKIQKKNQLNPNNNLNINNTHTLNNFNSNNNTKRINQVQTKKPIISHPPAQQPTQFRFNKVNNKPKVKIEQEEGEIPDI